MVLTGGQITVFFDNAAQMAIPHEMVVKLGNKCINTLDDLVDFDKDTIKQIAENL